MKKHDNEKIIGIIQNDGHALFDKINSLENKDDVLFLLLYFENAYYWLAELFRKENPDVDFDKVQSQVINFHNEIINRLKSGRE